MEFFFNPKCGFKCVPRKKETFGCCNIFLSLILHTFDLVADLGAFAGLNVRDDLDLRLSPWNPQCA